MLHVVLDSSSHKPIWHSSISTKQKKFFCLSQSFYHYLQWNILLKSIIGISVFYQLLKYSVVFINLNFAVLTIVTVYAKMEKYKIFELIPLRYRRRRNLCLDFIRANCAGNHLSHNKNLVHLHFLCMHDHIFAKTKQIKTTYYQQWVCHPLKRTIKLPHNFLLFKVLLAFCLTYRLVINDN